jgi:class 3 adenylate cyclase/predicted ATPase
MDFLEVIKQARAVLQSEGRITYRTLKRQFALDDEALEDLKFELIEGQEVATDKDGKMLVWVRDGDGKESENRGIGESETSSQPPSSYTPSHLAERIRAEQAAMESRGAADGERKTITALFADLKGSTALIEGLDPEDARAIIDPALQLMMDAVHRYDGYVAQALGDGIFALFGAPIAHEDHPQRALYAALRMQEEMRRYGDQIRLQHGVPLAMRVGINTGEVVVRSIRKDDLHTDYVPVGHSTNLAARMEQMATPGSILVTAYTHKLTDGYFAFKGLGQTQIKGVEEPLSVYEVLGAGPLRTRLQVAARRGLTRFVGRQSELEQLQRALEHAKAGHGQIVGTMGEPGLGKSRLFYEFVGARHAVPLLVHGCLVLEAYSVSHGKASSYLPVIELLKSYFRIESQDDERTRREKVTGKVLTLDRSLEETLPYLFALLGLEEQPSPLQQMDAQIRRRRTFEALKKLFLRESLNQPLILIFEDLHWIDAETQGFLDTLSESIASAKLLLLVNYRPEYRQEWGSKTYYTQLRLAPLGKAEAEEFLAALLGESPSPLPVGERARVRGMDNNIHALKQLILDKTEGTPFFMEEVVQELFEQGILVRDAVGAGLVPARIEGAHKGTPLQIPTTVQGVLAARIDRLAPEEKTLLQQLSVIGREFPLSLVQQVVSQPEEALHRILSSLQRKEFLYEQPAFPESEYLFKHALTQEVAYNSVLIERRKVLHEQTGQAIESLYKDNLDECYSELAHHYSRSGNTHKAVEYLYRAGQQAAQRSAHEEVVGHLTTALELLKTLPDTSERAQKELTLQLTLGPSVIATKGWAAPEVTMIYSRARELCQQEGDTSQLFATLWGLWIFHIVQADYEPSRELGEQLLALAQRENDSGFLVEAHYVQAAIHFWFRGEMVATREHAEQGISLYNPQQHRSLAFLHGSFDPGVACFLYAALALWVLGYPQQGRQKLDAALALARELSQPNSLAFALSFAALFHLLEHDEQAARERAEATVALTTEQGLPVWLAFGTLYRGRALAEWGQGEEGIAQIHQGLAALSRTAGQVGRPQWLALLAEAYGKVDQTEAGLSVLVEALDNVSKTEERFYEAELYRLKGQLTLQKLSVASSQWSATNPQSPTPNPQAEVEREAEACFLKAIDIARKQQAKSWELRAATSLARLWQQQGKKAEAHRLLSEVYNWFTEGFDTKDLQEAKVLLEELKR